MKAQEKNQSSKNFSKKVTKLKTRNSQDLLNAKSELGQAFVLTIPKIAQIKIEIKE